MFTVSVNGKEPVKTDLRISGGHFEGSFSGRDVKGDFIKINDHHYHFIVGGRSYNIDLLDLNREEKTVSLKVNSNKFTLQLKDKYDELLHSLGMDAMASKKINEVKAPMPGMVLNILVKDGDHVKKGDALIVLEAMKMENILKSPGEGTIKRIAAIKGTAVEKNQILIEFA